MKSGLAAIVAFVLLGSPALAEGIVTVHVTDAHSGKPLRGIAVTVTGAFGDLGGRTDKLGNVNFLNVPPGRSTVAAADEYVSPCTPYFMVSSDQHRTVNLIVSPRMPGQDAFQKLCAMSNLVNSGEGADVYDVP